MFTAVKPNPQVWFPWREGPCVTSRNGRQGPWETMDLQGPLGFLASLFRFCPSPPCSLGSWLNEGLPRDSEADHLSLTVYFINSRPPPTRQEPHSWPSPPRPPTPFQSPCSFDSSSSSKKPPLVIFFSPESSARRPLFFPCSEIPLPPLLFLLVLLCLL